jgi:CheY-like chemotaxis protein
MRILLVEDDDSIREVFKLVLEVEKPFSDLSVETASSGQMAIEVASLRRPDLVLLDLSLPGEHGFEIFKALRALSGCEQLPIIAVTAHNIKDLEQEAQELGFAAYITKPIDFEGALFPTMKAIMKSILSDSKSNKAA